MGHDPLDEVYSFVERAYVRLQAGDLLIRCLEEGSPGPITQMVENLILAGPQSMGVLREILAEAGERKAQVVDDLQQIFSSLELSLKTYGVILSNSRSGRKVPELTQRRLLRILKEQEITEENAQQCLQILCESRDLSAGLVKHIKLLEDIEKYLQDWLWGLAFQSARQGIGKKTDNS